MQPPKDRVDLVRNFNRFYTKQIGLLREGFLKTSFSLAQARVLYELGREPGIRSSALVEELGLDRGYLSRLLKNFEQRHLIKRRASTKDGRVSHLFLTASGQREFATLNARSQAEIAGMLIKLPKLNQQKLIASMTAIEDVLNTESVKALAFALRMHRPGDIGWVIARHGELYAEEYQWDSTFEGLVAQIAGKFLTNFDGERERCWIAEQDDQRLGCIFLVKESVSVAKLRLLLVEPSARGMGVGSALVAQCIESARQAGYRKLTLWTNDILAAARKLYERAGFGLVKQEKHHSFGHDLTGQFWELKLN